MSRPRTPTKVLEMRGAFQRNPKRRKEREHEPQVTAPLGKPPDCLNEAQRARWEEIAKWCTWLMQPDRLLVELIAREWVRVRDNAADADQKLLLAAMARLGLTPTDRSKIYAPDVPKVDRKARFFA